MQEHQVIQLDQYEKQHGPPSPDSGVVVPGLGIMPNSQ